MALCWEKVARPNHEKQKEEIVMKGEKSIMEVWEKYQNAFFAKQNVAGNLKKYQQI